MTHTRAGRDLARAVSAAVVLALVAAAVVYWAFQGANSNKVTAYFDQAVGVYAGSEVKVLGVQVGTIDDVTPQGKLVRVEMSLDRDVTVPANAQAVVVAPSVVSDRYVQLAPVYTGGARMTDNAVIPRERTATPVELDQLFDSLNKVSTSLGPNGANKNGDLSDLLNTLAKNLDGNGSNLHDTITQLGDAAKTLSGNKDDLFNTVDNLAKFTQALADSDAQVRDFSGKLADVSGFLAGEKTDLAQAVQQLGGALGQVQSFINDNRAGLKSNVDNLASVTKVLVDERGALAQTLDIAPAALTNLANTYNASSGTLDARIDLNELSQPLAVTVCKLLRQSTPAGLPQTISDLCDSLAPILQGLVALPTPEQVIVALRQGKLPPLPLPLAGTMFGSAAGVQAAAQGSGTTGGGQ